DDAHAHVFNRYRCGYIDSIGEPEAHVGDRLMNRQINPVIHRDHISDESALARVTSLSWIHRAQGSRIVGVEQCIWLYEYFRQLLQVGAIKAFKGEILIANPEREPVFADCLGPFSVDRSKTIRGWRVDSCDWIPCECDSRRGRGQRQ